MHVWFQRVRRIGEASHPGPRRVQINVYEGHQVKARWYSEGGDFYVRKPYNATIHNVIRDDQNALRFTCHFPDGSVQDVLWDKITWSEGYVDSEDQLQFDTPLQPRPGDLPKAMGLAVAIPDPAPGAAPAAAAPAGATRPRFL